MPGTFPPSPVRSPIPPTVHFVFGLREQLEPFHPLQYAAVRSAIDVLAPTRVVLHVHNLPYGMYWDLLRSLVELRRVAPVAGVERSPADPLVDRYRYAHHADVIRLDALLEDGGVYCDIDTLWVRPLPAEVWSDADCVLGAEPDVADPVTGAPVPSLTNAVIAARPGAPFLRRWRDRVLDEMDGSWSAHSCQLARRLADQHPSEVTILPREAFSYPGHSRDTLARVLEGEGDLPDTVLALHLCAHLWWEEERRDFSDVHAGLFDEASLRAGHSVVARVAARHLPERWW